MKTDEHAAIMQDELARLLALTETQNGIIAGLRADLSGTTAELERLRAPKQTVYLCRNCEDSRREAHCKCCFACEVMDGHDQCENCALDEYHKQTCVECGG